MKQITKLTVLAGLLGGGLMASAQEVAIPAMPATPPPHWLSYHLIHPGPGNAFPGDPNCAFYWKGKYHLHYIYNNDGVNFAHVFSDDMVHWKWQPTTLTQKAIGHGMFSGTGFFTKEGKPAIIYHGWGSGKNQLAIAQDDKLETWSKSYPLEPKIKPGQDGGLIANWDPDAWLDGDNYYALSGGSPGSGKPPTLFKSTDLKNWIAYIPATKTLMVGKVDALFELKPGEDLTLRVFIDKNLVEVFANDRQAALAARGGFAPENLGINLFSTGADATVKQVKGWKMKSSYTDK